MNKSTAEFLIDKCVKLLNAYEPKVKLFDTALEMLQFYWPDNYINAIKHYELCMKEPSYVSGANNFTFYKSVYSQPSLAGMTSMKLFGLSTSPEVSVTYEGQSMADFTFTVFHEIGHIALDTVDEATANSFALLHNKNLWKMRV